MRAARVLLARLHLSLHLLLQRSPGLVLAIDAVLLLAVMGYALMEGAWTAFWMAVVGPYLLLGLPLLSDAIALERRAGCLDLALSSPGGSHYFERRAAALGASALVQGALVVILARILLQEFLVAPALLRTVVVIGFLLAVVLFWATRLATAGAIAVASVATAALFLPWLVALPIHGGSYVELLETPRRLANAFVPDAVLLAAALLLYAYARRRLARPELLLRSGGWS